MYVNVERTPAAWSFEAATDPQQTPWRRFLNEVAEGRL